MILCVNHVVSNEKIFFSALIIFHQVEAPSIRVLNTMGPTLMDDLSGILLKDGGSPMLDARSQPIMGCTLMIVRAGQQPIRVFTLTVTFQEPPE